MMRLLFLYAVSILSLFQQAKGLAVPSPDGETTSMLQSAASKHWRIVNVVLAYFLQATSDYVCDPNMKTRELLGKNVSLMKAYSPPQRLGNQITANDVLVAYAHTSTERPLSPADTTRLLFLSMVNLFHTAAGSGGDLPLPKAKWRKQWDHYELTVLPDFDQDMRLSEAFFALGWIWSFMAVPIPEFGSRHYGFHERDYVVFRKESGGGKRIVGYIRMGYRGGYQIEQPVPEETSANSSSVALAANLTDTSRTAALSYPYGPFFLVPESKIWLYFLAPRTRLPYGADKVLSYLLLSILQQAWSVMIEHGGGYSFPATTRSYPALGLSVATEPKRAGYRQQSLMTAAMVAESAFGVVYYMLHEGFSGGKVSMRVPTASGMRIALGDFLVRYSGGPSALLGGGGDGNGTAPAVATS
ncbi:MAG: hypothetical protein LQ346_007054 [Caloplaca aetnensis]|nr:MAG: hypothetical protein LQ346_007054 [Caloplaca aetnensis]